MTFVGALLGLLFGIPKSNYKDEENREISENTNLEDVSDWLTKIILGLGIAEISSFNESIASLVQYLYNFTPAVDKLMLVGIVIFFPIYGFIFGWLITRVHLTELFVKLSRKIREKSSAIEMVLTKIDDQSDVEVSKDIAPEIDSQREINDVIADVKYLEDKNYPLSWETYNELGVLFNSKQNFGTAADYFKKSFQLSNNPKPRINYAVVLGRSFGNNEEAITILENVIKNYPDDENIARAYYNKACAHSRLKDVQNAIESLRESISLAPRYLSTAKTDAAFKNISESNEFKELIPGYSPVTDHLYYKKESGVKKKERKESKTKKNDDKSTD